MNVRDLEPKAVWNHFSDLNEVPRPSKKEELVIAFMQDFGAKLGLETYTDAVGNVIITKPATIGMEDRQTVIMQSHLDMVHQKNSDTDFDFDTQGIEMYVDGDWVRANGTTLGADNGMGVAAILAVLSSTDITHPTIEALFTIDEETGMTGAMELEKGVLKGTILLNLDTEDDDEFSIGCAGGIDTNTTYKYAQEAIVAGSQTYNIIVNGLNGGHSGVQINEELGNANKIMNRLMYGCEEYNLQIVSINGGSLRNAIPRESFATVTVSPTYLEEFEKRVKDIKGEYVIQDAGLSIQIEATSQASSAMSLSETKKVTTATYACHNGVFRYSRAIEGLVETSSSLARIIVKDGEFITQSLQRSSVESGKYDVAYTVAAPFHLMGCEVQHKGDYPGWSPNPTSPILDVLVAKYKELFNNEEPKVMAIHAGLECGLLGERIPGLDMISFGPTIKGAHSPDERCGIKSTAKFWMFLKEILANVPKI
ncbi:aminoacyl-histidine dipeptidase [Bacteroidia bacterium]|nr:aminoacyl-histidine dipeptidase [Bacteroidia bacterium]MDB9882724.1 aminoacyl-histidine dipeptidase [Bacteroidia bacterium]